MFLKIFSVFIIAFFIITNSFILFAQPESQKGKIVFAPIAVNMEYTTFYKARSIIYKGVYIMNLDGTGKIQLASDLPTISGSISQEKLITKSIDFVKFSPDGKWVTFVKEGDLWIIKPDGTGKKKLISISFFDDDYQRRWGYYDWSPNSKKIAFIKDGGLFIMNPDGTGIEEITKHIGSPNPYYEDSYYNYSPFSFANDSKLIAYYDGALKIKRISDGSCIGIWNLNIDKENITDINFFDNNTKIAMMSFSFGVNKAYLYISTVPKDNTDNSMIESLSAEVEGGTGKFNLACSPNDDKLVLLVPSINEKNELDLINSKGEIEKTLVTCNGYSIKNIRPIFISPDGKKIAGFYYNFTEQNNFFEIILLDINGKNRCKLNYNNNLFGDFETVIYNDPTQKIVNWSSNSLKLAFAEWWGFPPGSYRCVKEYYTGVKRANKIYICNIDGTGLHEIPIDSQVSSYDICW